MKILPRGQPPVAVCVRIGRPFDDQDPVPICPLIPTATDSACVMMQGSVKSPVVLKSAKEAVYLSVLNLQSRSGKIVTATHTVTLSAAENILLTVLRKHIIMGQSLCSLEVQKLENNQISGSLSVLEIRVFSVG